MASMSKGDQVKILVAAVALAVGGLLIAWNFGAFDSVLAKKADPNTKFTEAQKKEAVRQQKRAEDLKEIAPPSGS